MPPRRSKRSRPAKNEEHSDHDEEDTAVDLSKSVLGGMKGGSRLDGSEGKDQDDEDTFKLPFNDKFIICQRHSGPQSDDGEPGGTSLIFTHGAGGGIANPATAEFDVRRKMQAKTWSLVVSGADHSMSLKQKDGVATMRAKTGQIAAEWLRQRSKGTEAIARWDGETSEVEVSAWHGNLNASRPSKPAGDNRLQDPKPARKRRPAQEVKPMLSVLVSQHERARPTWAYRSSLSLLSQVRDDVYIALDLRHTQHESQSAQRIIVHTTKHFHALTGSVSGTTPLRSVRHIGRPGRRHDSERV
ncbi:hypothetical protein KVT40_002633 [Elsinoe batatas]|uniref:Uncharacterized protein n=1 Tax=Elsinoe batatas TaxID=2601811 RepID=A0A8K0PIR1_9PEZI|nr:hypothetical protein KVT40_002633 [Elsinoe batatas]